MEAIHGLALIAGAINAYAFWRYNKDVFVGSTSPNAATWFLWALVTVVQATTYHGMRVHWTTLVVMISDSGLCIITFFFLLLAGKFGKLDRESGRIVALSIGAVILWQVTSAALGNAMSQIPYALAFLPTIRDARDGKTIEDPQVWVLFTISFVVNFIVVCIQWSGKMEEFLFSVVAIVMHAILTHYAFRGRRIHAPATRT